VPVPGVVEGSTWNICTILALACASGQDAAVTDPADDVATRGRAIFQRLRAQGGGGESADAAEEGASATEGGAPPEPAAPPRASEPEAGAEPEPAAEPTGAAGHAAAPGPGLTEEELAAFTVPPPPEHTTAPDADPPRGPLPGAEDLPVVPADPAAPADAGEPPPAPPILDPADVVDEPSSAGPPPRRSFARDLPRVMAVANQKGGVGKTTTAVNLGACLADIGYRVLVVDLDPQGNASTGLGINIRDLQGSMYDVILHDLPIELVPAFSRELRLKRALDEVHDDYDFVLIDCPPSLGLLTVNGLAAATEVVVPIQCEYYALEGLGQLLRNVNLVQKNLNPVLEVSAIVLVMYDARTKLADQVVNEVREHFGDKVCRNVVPRTVRLSEAPSFGQPIIAFDPSSRGAIAYRELAKEVSGGTPQRAR
jgi:chromosome partitioning protein